MEKELTKNEAKCSDVKTALKPTTGTKAANSVPSTTCICMHTVGVNSFQNSLIPVNIQYLTRYYIYSHFNVETTNFSITRIEVIHICENYMNPYGGSYTSHKRTVQDTLKA